MTGMKIFRLSTKIAYHPLPSWEGRVRGMKVEGEGVLR
jgi:hypothetical protein